MWLARPDHLIRAGKPGRTDLRVRPLRKKSDMQPQQHKDGEAERQIESDLVKANFDTLCFEKTENFIFPPFCNFLNHRR